jgi:hypothetical protein
VDTDTRNSLESGGIYSFVCHGYNDQMEELQQTDEARIGKVKSSCTVLIGKPEL